MSAETELYTFSPQERDIHTPPNEFFPDLLRRTQNPDGGWGYRAGFQSAAEPTAWAALALAAHEAPSGKVLSAASGWLRQAQSKEGAWPTASGKEPGCWVSALACLALLNPAASPEEAVIRGTKWLCSTWPAEARLLWRWRSRRHRKSDTIIRQNHSLRGWGWTPETASWVEPTAYVLIMLQNIPVRIRPSRAIWRIEMGEKLLYDRACPGGGWNAGNPLVYGVPGVPRVGPTVWALLALRNHKEGSANVEGIEWLARSYRNLHSPGSLALAQLCLRVYGRAVDPVEARLGNFYAENQFLQSTPVIAWASMALNDLPCWLECPSQAKDAL